MVLLSLAAGGACASGAASMYAYNRDAWMTDIQVNQNRRFQRQQIRIAQNQMFREDIRDLIAAAVTKQNNYVIIATLVLGMIGEAYVGGTLPRQSAEFLLSAYLLCTGSALLYMVMAVLCAVAANQLAVATQRDLLTTLVRLPIDEFEAEIDEAAPEESTEAFERQGIARVLRVPGMALFQDHPPGDPGSPPRKKLQEQAKRLPAPKDEEAGFHCAALASSCTLAHAERAELHLAIYRRKEREWDVLGKYSFIFGCHGLSHLLEAYGYYAAARVYMGDRFCSVVVQLIIILADAMLAHAYIRGPSWVGFLEVLGVVAGPLACTLAVHLTDPLVDRVCIPLCFLLHLSYNCLGAVKLLAVEAHRKTAHDHDHTQPLDEEDPHSKGSGSIADSFSGGSSRRWGGSSALRRRRRRRVALLASGIVISGWMAGAVWSLVHAATGDGDDGGPVPQRRPWRGRVQESPRPPSSNSQTPKSAPTPKGSSHEGDHRLLEGLEGLSAGPVLEEETFPLAAFQELPVAWPSLHFEPRAVACDPMGNCVVASEFVAFELPPLSASGAPPWPTNVSVVRRLRCAAPAPWVDVAMLCNSPDESGVEACGAHALRAGGSGSELVDCQTGVAAPLHGTSGPVRRIATPDGGRAALFTLEGKQIMQRERAETAAGGWSPVWRVAEGTGRRGGSPAALAAEGRVLLRFSAEGLVEAWDVETAEPCALWRLPRGARQVLAAAALPPRSPRGAGAALRAASTGAAVGDPPAPEEEETLWPSALVLVRSEAAGPAHLGVIHLTGGTLGGCRAAAG